MTSVPNCLARMSRNFTATVFFCMLIVQLISETRGQDLLEISVNLDSAGQMHRAQIANFGYQFRDDIFFEANLMLPPDDEKLCEFPSSLVSMEREEMALNETKQIPIALLVARGACEFRTKALVALKMRQKFSERLKYVIVYENYPRRDTVIMSAPEEFQDENPEVESMGFVFVTFRSGTMLKNELSSTTIDDKSFIFQGNLSQAGDFPIIMEYATYSWGSGNNPLGNAARDSFYWLRFVLFSLLIVSPCIRAAYLWYAGGGRVISRRNSNGRIVGLQYVRPMAVWFTSGTEEQAEVETSVLTEAELDALPLTKYRKTECKDEASLCSSGGTTKSVESTNSTSDCEQGFDQQNVLSTEKIGVQCEGKQPTLDNEDDKMELRVSKSMREVDCGQALEQDRTTSTEDVSAQNKLTQQKSAEENEDEKNIILSQISSTCTMCSICIDDFEDGEQILVLPKCRHGFHAACIKPWLTERQGCCPLCKTAVNSVERGDSEDPEHTRDGPDGSRPTA